MSRVSYVPSAALVVRAKTFKELNGFQESLRYGEDVDFVWRAIDNNWQCRYDPYVVCLHRNRNSWRELARQRMSYGEAAATLYIAHPTRLAPLRSDVATTTSVAAIALGMPLTALAAGSISATFLWKELRRVGLPATHVMRIVANRLLHTADMLAHAISRVWWPIIAVVAIFSRRARYLLVGSLVFPVLYQQRRSSGHAMDRNQVPFALIARIVDHGGYSVGVWKGMMRHRTFGPLIPKISVKRSPSN
jgi:hypothetical protein